MTDKPDPHPFVREVKMPEGPEPPEWKFKLWDIQSRLELRFARPLRWMHESSPRRHLRRWIERARQGWSVEDSWSFQMYLARVIAGGVRQIHKEGHGNPMSLEFEEWQGMLLEIAEGFELIAADELPQSNVEKAKIARAKALFAEWFEHLWD